jgi:hypothetical protein
MAAVAAADAAAEATATTAVAAETEAAAAATKGAGGGQQRERRQQGQGIVVYVAYLCYFSNKFISYISYYVGPIQTGFLRGFRKVLAEQES